MGTTVCRESIQKDLDNVRVAFKLLEERERYSQ